MEGHARPRSSRRRLVLLLWILVAFFYFYLSYNYIRVSSNDRSLGDYLDHVVQLAGNQNRPAKDIRTLILVKAEALGLAIQGEQIEIVGAGQTLNVKVAYDADIEVPVIERLLFKKKFYHESAYRPPR